MNDDIDQKIEDMIRQAELLVPKGSMGQHWIRMKMLLKEICKRMYELGKYQERKRIIMEITKE